MTRKDYKAIAEVIKPQMAGEILGADSAYIIVRRIIIGIAEVMERDNPLFDRVRFFTACGLEPDHQP